MFSSVSCGADTQGIRISDGVWSGTVIPDAADAETAENAPEDIIVTEPSDDTGAVTDAVISSDESEPVTMPDSHPDESAPETAPADTTANDTTDRSEPLPDTTAAPETVRAPETTKAPETKAQETTKAPETTSAPAATSQSSSSDRKTGTVYWVESGKVWHTTDKCSTLSRSKDIMSGTVDAAKAAGKERVCKRCGGG